METSSNHSQEDVMTDPYRLIDQPEAGPRSSPSGTGTDVATGLVWLLLAISAAANSVASLASVPIAVHLGLGAVTAVCLGLLITWHRRGRR
jgi:hypothetical protein